LKDGTELSSFLINEEPDLSRFDPMGIHNFAAQYPDISQAVIQDIANTNVLRDSDYYGIDIYHEILQKISM